MLQDELEQTVEALRSLGSDFHDVEAKASKSTLPSSVKETLSSFSNTSGGTIILGLAEERGFAATGIDDPAKIAADAASMCANEIEPPIRPVITQMSVDGSPVVIVEVPELEPERKPAFVKARGITNGSYVRVNDADQRMSPYEVQMVLSNRGQPTYDIDAVPSSTIDDLDPGLVEAYVTRSRQTHARATVGLDSPRHVRRHDSLEGSVSWDVPASIRASFVSALSVWSPSCGPTIRASTRR